MSVTPKRRKKTGGVGKSDLIKVLLMPVGGTEKTVNLKQDTTVAEALEAVGLSFDSNTEVRDNGDVLDADDLVEDGDELVIFSGGKIEGGGK